MFNTNPAVGVQHDQTGPRHSTKVFVEHSSGVFLTGDQSKDRQQEDERQFKFLAALERMTAWTTAKEDAANYEPFMEQVAFVCRRMLELVCGFCAGFSIFLMLSAYSTKTGSERDNFLSVYSMHYEVTQKVFMSTALAGVMMAVLPFSHEAGLSRRRTAKGQKKDHSDNAEDNGSMLKGLYSFLDQQGLAPFRRLGSIQLWSFVGCLITTIITTSVEQGRTPEQIKALPDKLVSRLHIAIIIRGVLHIVAWLAVFFSPIPHPKGDVAATVAAVHAADATSSGGGAEFSGAAVQQQPNTMGVTSGSGGGGGGGVGVGSSYPQSPGGARVLSPTTTSFQPSSYR